MPLSISELSLAELQQVTPTENSDGTRTYLIAQSTANDQTVTLTYETFRTNAQGGDGYEVDLDGQLAGFFPNPGDNYSDIPDSVKEDAVHLYNYIVENFAGGTLDVPMGPVEPVEIEIDIPDPVNVKEQIIETQEREAEQAERQRLKDEAERKAAEAEVKAGMFQGRERDPDTDPSPDTTPLPDPDPTPTTETVIETYPKNTRFLLTDKKSPITNVILNGAYLWREGGKVLKLDDIDLGTDDSGSLFFEVPQGMTIDLRMAIEARGFGSDLRHTVGDEVHSAPLGSPSEFDMPSEASNSQFFSAVMTGGDRLSIDLDSEDPNVHQFRWIIGDEKYEVGKNVDDEVYINISNPLIEYERDIQTGDPVAGGLLDGERNADLRGDKDKTREPGILDNITWGWVAVIGGLALVVWLVFQRTKEQGGDE